MGDIARAHNATAGRPLTVEHWGVLTHRRDADYERGRELVQSAAALP